VDVRSFPHSYRNPQFNKETIELELPPNGIEYAWLKNLGGRRKGLGKSSPNMCWRNQSFRNFADYMETNEFREGIRELTNLARRETVAIMCAEVVYWRCHRSMIADYLKSEEVEVTHILDAAHSKEHTYTRCAKVIEGRLTYHS
jgi:uncharacterized protein (DUF488 family)